MRFRGPIPIFLGAVQGDFISGSSQPRLYKRASQLTNGKGPGTWANWQAEGVVKNLVFPLDALLRDIRAASQAKHRDSNDVSSSAHPSQQEAKLLISMCKSKYWQNGSELGLPLSPILTDTQSAPASQLSNPYGWIFTPP